MKNKVIQILGLALISSIMVTNSYAADYVDGDRHKNDYGWLQLNLMRSVDAKLPYDIKNDTYLETEFGARYGVLDLYGYVDIFDIFNSKHDDRHGDDNFLLKYHHVFRSMVYLPRISHLAQLKSYIWLM